MSGLSKKITCHYGGLESWQSFQPTGIIPRHCRLSRPLSLLLCYSATLQFCCCSCRLADSGGQTACCRSLCLSAAAGRLKVAASCKVAAPLKTNFGPAGSSEEEASAHARSGEQRCPSVWWRYEISNQGELEFCKSVVYQPTILNHLNTQITPLSLSN